MLRLVAIVSLKCAYLEISISGNYIDNFGLCKFGFTYAAVIPPSLYAIYRYLRSCLRQYHVLFLNYVYIIAIGIHSR